MKKLIVLMLTFILFFTVFNITPQLKIQIAKAVTINVYPGDSIQDAIDSASPGDTIHVFNGIYEEIINIDVEDLTLEGQDKDNTIIIDSYYLGDAVEVSASNVKIKNFTIKNAEGNGVIAENINNMTIENCIIENNGAYGIYLLASSNTISNCEIFENYYSGIKIGGLSYAEANNNNVINCEFYDNGYGGLQDNVMAAVSISPIYGIVTNTKIVDCLFYSSWAYDIYVEGNNVANNMFSHNNFLSKTVTDNVYDSCSNDIWYNDTLGEGNFWIDYTGEDTDGDGIGDTPYNIPGGSNQDEYPLMDPLGLYRPVANANGPYTANKGVEITFNASDSYDPDGDLENPYLFYEWDLGNGDIMYGITAAYTYYSIGTYNVTLIVEDYHGLTDSDTTIAVITGSPNNPPEVPYDPIPSNGSVDVDVNDDLSWVCDDPDGDALTFDVYFGTASLPPKVSSNQSSKTYDTGIMNYNTKYYWKIAVWDEHGASSTGPIWDFTTKVNNPPDPPRNPNPSNHNISVDINADLSWLGGDTDSGDNVFYDVYFGTSSNPTIVSHNQTDTSFEPGPMDYNTKYYWKIVAWDNHGANTIGSLWDFTTNTEPNEPPIMLSNPNPVNHTIGVSLDAILSWTGGDPDSGNTVTYDVYFGTSNPPEFKETIGSYPASQTSLSYDPGTIDSNTKYYWKVKAKDNYGASKTSPVWDFTTIYVNQPPNTPFNPTPQNGSTNVNINQNLYWNAGDLNSNDTVTYDIYFGTSNPPEFKETIGSYPASQTSLSYDSGTMNYDTKYYWNITSEDNHGTSSTGQIWSFTTEQQSSDGENGGGGGGFLPPNTAPIANASASDNSGFVNKSITFDGSYSVDHDGEITNYTWDFGDGGLGYGVITTHIYKKTGTYNVKLTVTDDNDVSDTDSVRVIISETNNLPTAPQIDGPKTGKKNIEYNFTVFSTDLDNDNIQYVFSWGDNQTNETDFVANGTIYKEKHKWTNPGIYKIRIYAIDSNYAVSASADITILIDIIYCKDIGYFIDENSDGIYDAFYSNNTGLLTDLIFEGEDYLIDIDGDGIEDYFYNLKNDLLSQINTHEKDEISYDENIVLYLIALIVVIILIILFIIVKRSKSNIQDEDEKKRKKDSNYNEEVKKK